MKHYQYLIVGGGMAGDAAVRGIRELDPNGSIGMFSMEPDPPYTRPNLSKGLWKGRPMEKVWRNTPLEGVDMQLGHKVTSLDPSNRRVIDDRGDEIGYDKLLLATGGTPIHLPLENHIIYFRDLQDYLQLRKLADEKERFLVIGGGFIGSEIAAALTMVGRKVTMVFLEDAIGGRIFPGDLAHYLNHYYQEKGVEVVTRDSVASVDEKDGHYVVRTGTGREFEVDAVVAGIGIRPNVELAEAAGLQVENGIVVDGELRTPDPNIYAAGDAANFVHSALGKRTRVEHEDNALKMGKLAGRNMAGANEVYSHTPMFYSDLFDLGYEAVGDMRSEMDIVFDWQEPYQKGVIYYLDQSRVAGVLLWNVWKKVEEARKLLLEPGPFDESNLKGRIKE
ncbi:MAG: FAD/NAD(P)-binding oxidoreductase [Chloroflexota bacterium]